MNKHFIEKKTHKRTGAHTIFRPWKNHWEVIWGEKQKTRSRDGKKEGGHMCHPTAAIEVSSVSFCVCAEQVWESEFVNACYQRGGGSGPAINTAIRGRAGLWADRGPTECFITSSHSEFVPSLRSPSPIITTERLSTAREHTATERNSQDTQPLLSHGLLIPHTHSNSVPTWGLCVCTISLIVSVNTSVAQSQSL